MSLNRLTIRAKGILENVSEKEYVVAGEILDAITNASGMGSYLLKLVTSVKLKKSQKVSIEHLVKEAFFQSIKFQHPYVGTEHLFLALLKITNSPAEEDIRKEILKLNVFPDSFKHSEFDDKAPLLSSFSTNLTHGFFKSNELGRIQRKELKTLFSTILQKNNYNTLIVGEVGVGKRSLVELLTQKIISLDVPPLLIGYQVIELDLSTFIASIFNKPGNIQSSINTLVDEIKSLNRSIIYIKNLHNIFVSTNSGIAVPIVYSFLKASLDSAKVRVIATMDLNLHDKLVAENNQLFEGFTVIQLDEPSEENILEMMQSYAVLLERFHNVKINKKLVKYTYEKAKTLDMSTKFPQKGVNIIDRACAVEILNKNKVPSGYKGLVDSTFEIADEMDSQLEEGKYDDAVSTRKKLIKLEKQLIIDEGKMFFGQGFVLTQESIDEVIKEELSEIELSGIKVDKLRELASVIKKKIIGQTNAVDIVVKSLIRASLGLRGKKRPIGSFLFLGPTGVGKTELAKILSQEAFGEDSLIRLDMSDFGEKHTVARLVGAPPGYVGYGEGGELTSKIERKPDSVVLFDEIEKAHPDVMNILLQIMEEAELTDARGNRYDFNEAIIVLTSNLGTEILHQGNIGFDESLKGDSAVEDRLIQNLKKILKPELINRFDDVVVFKRLNKKDQTEILNLLIQEIRLSLKKQDIKLTIDSQAKAKLLTLGYSDEYGARSLRRTLEKEVLDRVANLLLTTTEENALTTIHITVEKDELIALSKNTSLRSENNVKIESTSKRTAIEKTKISKAKSKK